MVNSYTTEHGIDAIVSNMLITLILLLIREGGFAIYNILV